MFAPVKVGFKPVLPYKRQGASHENIFKASLEAEACSHMRQRVVIACLETKPLIRRQQ